MASPTRQQLRGKAAEDLACHYLQQHGLQLIETNYHCRAGEIDLIMRHRDALVFVEVRFRSNARHGSALESITAHKRSRLLRTAEHYLQRKALHHTPCRFDVVAITPQDRQDAEIQWIQNAFHA